MLDKFIPLNQHPELPTGCEITSLAMVLMYYGFDTDKCELAEKYLENRGSEMRARNISGRQLEELFVFTDSDIPIMIWCTIGMKKGYYSTEWVINGKKLVWYAREHCTVLLGHDGDISYIADPYTGHIEKYRTSLLKTRYDELFRQAVVIC